MSPQSLPGLGSGVEGFKSVNLTITRKSFEQIENFIADNEASVAKVNVGIDLLARGMVMVMKGIAQGKSFGPVAANRRSNPVMANRIPVQRITGRYYAGWTQRKLGNGHWVFYNDSVEAYLIEYGLYQRSRRPILKLSLLGMLKFLQTTQTAERFLDWVIAPRRNDKGQFQSFQARIAGTATINSGGSLAGPTGDLP